MNILAQWFPNVVHRLPEFIDSFVQTLIMVAVTGVLSFMLSTVFAVGLTLTQRDGLAQQTVAFNVLDKLINLFRSIRSSFLRRLWCRSLGRWSVRQSERKERFSHWSSVLRRFSPDRSNPLLRELIQVSSRRRNPWA